MKEGRSKLVFNPEYIIKPEANGFIIRSKEKELFLEFKDEIERQYFAELVQNDVYKDSIPTENLQALMQTLIEEQLVFCFSS